MYYLKVKYYSIDYKEYPEEEAKTKFQKWKDYMKQQHTCIEKLTLINNMGEIIDEYKREQ